MPEPLSVLRSQFVFLPQANVDTDQIVPARFMATTSSKGMGRALFHDVRHREGQTNDHVLNHVNIVERKILLAGENFGCGSSREHAVWALTDFGFRVVLAPSIADIFKANALNNGLLAIEIGPSLFEVLSNSQNAAVIVDLEGLVIEVPAKVRVSFHIDAFARHCLLNGLDRLDYLLRQREQIRTFESRRDSMSS